MTSPRYTGRNAQRQSIGQPGHCDKCAEVGHIKAHPHLGCSDVGCTSSHNETPEVQRAISVYPTQAGYEGPDNRDVSVEVSDSHQGTVVRLTRDEAADLSAKLSAHLADAGQFRLDLNASQVARIFQALCTERDRLIDLEAQRPAHLAFTVGGLNPEIETTRALIETVRHLPAWDENGRVVGEVAAR